MMFETGFSGYEWQRRIEDVLLEYVHDIDDDKLETWPEYFTEDAVYQIIPRKSFEGSLPLGIFHCEGKGMMIDRINALRTANIFEPHSYCHMLGRSQVIKCGTGSCEARTSFSVVRTKQDGGMEIFAVGKYLDKISLEGERLLLCDRRVVLDSHRIDILLVVPI